MRKKQYIRRRHTFCTAYIRIIGTWFLTVLVIQYCTSTQQPVKNTIPVSRFVRPKQKEQTVHIPWNLILINHENLCPDGFQPDLTTLNNGPGRPEDTAGSAENDECGQKKRALSLRLFCIPDRRAPDISSGARYQ